MKYGIDPMVFNKGDVVQVDFKSTRLIERWMQGGLQYGPGDVGVVKYQSYDAPAGVSGGEMVTVTFPMIGTFGVASQHLRVMQRAEVESSPK